MLETVIAHHAKLLADAQSVLDTDGNIFSYETRAQASVEVVRHGALLKTLRAAEAKLTGADLPLWMHVKRGSVYHDFGEAMAQCDFNIRDEEMLRLYRDVDTGAWFVRPPMEFDDGRFLPVIHSTPKSDDVIIVSASGNTLALREGSTPDEQAAFAKLQAGPDVEEETITLHLIVPNEDPRMWKLPESTWIKLRDAISARLGEFTVTPEMTEEEDMWGGWRVDAIEAHDMSITLRARRA